MFPGMMNCFLAVWWDGEQVWINGSGERIKADLCHNISIAIDFLGDQCNRLAGISARHAHPQVIFAIILQIKVHKSKTLYLENTN